MFRFFKKKPPAPPATTPAASPPEADTSAPQIAAVPPPAVAPTAAPIVAPVAAPAPAPAPAPTAAPIAAPVPAPVAAPVAAPVPPPVQPAPAPAFEAAPAAAPVQAPAPAPAFEAAPVAVPAAPVVSVSTPVTDTAAPHSPAITAAPGSFAAPKAIDAPTPVSAPENTVPVTQNDLAAAVTEAPTVVPAVSTPSLSAQPPVQVVPPVQPTPPVQATPFTKPSAPAVTPPAPPEPAKKASWLSRLKQGLSRTGQTIGNLFIDVPVDENLFEELESALIMADAGVEATAKLLTALRARVKKDRLDDATKVKRALREILADHLRPLEKTFDTNRAQPLVVMIAGVNGAGKTTSIGKLAHTFQQQGASVLLAAGDTFRAAAREQLVEWGRRNNVTVISQDGGDPAAVAFDAVNAGRARKTGVVMIDTAGRLPTQLNLMEELKKIRRVIGKADPQAPHEVLLVIDGNTGQNAIAQIRAFDAAITLTGLVVTKLDGTAKGGTLAAVAAGSQGVRPVPVYWIGVGEGMQDLQPFVADEFAQALLGD